MKIRKHIPLYKRIRVDGIGGGGSLGTPNIPTYWYHRYSNYIAEVVAVSKNIIPVFNVFNPVDTDHAARLALALEFAEDNDCDIVLKMNFWPQDTVDANCWDVSETWANNLEGRLTASGHVTSIWLDVEPPDEVLTAMTTHQASDEEYEDAENFVAEQTAFDVALPDLRTAGDPQGTLAKTIYTVLPGLGTRRMNEWTYAPGRDYSTVDAEDIIGLRISVDGSSGTYTPEAAKLSWSGRQRFYFPVGRTGMEAEDELEMVNRL